MITPIGGSGSQLPGSKSIHNPALQGHDNFEDNKQSRNAPQSSTVTNNSQQLKAETASTITPAAIAKIQESGLSSPSEFVRLGSNSNIAAQAGGSGAPVESEGTVESAARAAGIQATENKGKNKSARSELLSNIEKRGGGAVQIDLSEAAQNKVAELTSQQTQQRGILQQPPTSVSDETTETSESIETLQVPPADEQVEDNVNEAGSKASGVVNIESAEKSANIDQATRSIEAAEGELSAQASANLIEKAIDNQKVQDVKKALIGSKQSTEKVLNTISERSEQQSINATRSFKEDQVKNVVRSAEYYESELAAKQIITAADKQKASDAEILQASIAQTADKAEELEVATLRELQKTKIKAGIEAKEYASETKKKNAVDNIIYEEQRAVDTIRDKANAPKLGDALLEQGQQPNLGDILIQQQEEKTLNFPQLDSTITAPGVESNLEGLAEKSFIGSSVPSTVTPYYPSTGAITFLSLPSNNINTELLASNQAINSFKATSNLIQENEQPRLSLTA